MNDNEIYTIFICFAACVSVMIGLSAWCYQMYKYQQKLLVALEKLKNSEGNKIIPTIDLQASLLGLKYSIFSSWIVLVSTLIVLVIKIHIS